MSEGKLYHIMNKKFLLSLDLILQIMLELSFSNSLERPGKFNSLILFYFLMIWHNQY